MAKKTALERIEERITQLQNSRAAEIQQHAERIEAAHARATEARRRMDLAEAAGDLDSYKAAKLDIIDAETEIEFATNRTNKLHSSALVDTEEGKRVLREILAEETEAQAADEAAVIECIKTLRTIGTRNKRRREKLNEVLNTWQNDICKGTAGATIDDNKKVWTFAENCINDNQYRQIAGEPIGTAHTSL